MHPADCHLRGKTAGRVDGLRTGAIRLVSLRRFHNEERNRMPTIFCNGKRCAGQKARAAPTMIYGVRTCQRCLEEQFIDRSDGLWGVYRFKRGFGGEVRRTIGAWTRSPACPVSSLPDLHPQPPRSRGLRKELFFLETAPSLPKTMGRLSPTCRRNASDLGGGCQS